MNFAKIGKISMTCLSFSFLCTISDCALSCSKNEEKSTDAKEINSKNISSGCYRYDFSSLAGGERNFLISMPKNFSGDQEYKLVFVFSGTGSTSRDTKEFIGDMWPNHRVGLEQGMQDTVFIYPDAKERFFEDWGMNRGWLLGKNSPGEKGRPSDSKMEDINFVNELFEFISKKIKIKKDGIFATGHSWGGDMTSVVACFSSVPFRAIAPVAANQPFWFKRKDGGYEKCPTSTEVWIWFGKDDEYFEDLEKKSAAKNNSDPRGYFGRLQAEFWKKNNDCTSSTNVWSPYGSTINYKCSHHPILLTIYPSNSTSITNYPGHQPPDDFPKIIAKWFESIK
ncbi:alpha/beta hydrolase-fold protein [Burkholderia pseudomallei]|uniref:alpha/beta hydrolase-fold protein n=1 Tax=Burkholderia pseudomallei TaxID=28450 RepID=UPI0005389A85|nr:hypothetical protein [Burkholderia pseudomallei]KGW80509.1 esterase family protein [Burkholderia pseudomallei MSHR456]MBF3523542.1 hypothetical protein [Burkholderia pseudomallei]MBF3540388.1 hypothetical protein [Burkholderia pseudomallei]MBF3602576.1 hypothetical protein [Burkholderia pseudomallei]CRY44929.1 Poly(3-hydroxybutyrate) depolymerase [Burkholderia pseudomallei]